MKMFAMYIIQSTKTGKYYIGSSQNVEARKKQHELGYTKSLKSKGPFIVAYREYFLQENKRIVGSGKLNHTKEETLLKN